MKSFITIIFYFFFVGLRLFGQSNYLDLKEKFLNADSVFVISYESKGDSIQGLEYLLKEEDFYNFLLKIKQGLNISQRAKLIGMLTSGKRISGRKSTSGYFKPRNAILIYKNASLSYIDICFSCQRINTTKDIDFDDFDIKADKWKALKQFFRNQKLIDNL